VIPLEPALRALATIANQSDGKHRAGENNGNYSLFIKFLKMDKR